MSLRSKHHRHERIVRLHQTALSHIARDGVQGLRLSMLAKELGYTTAALYRYYPSKEALIAELQKNTLIRMRHALSCFLEEALAEADMSEPLAPLLISAHFYARYARCSPASFALNSNIFSSHTLLLHGERRQGIIMVMRRLLEVIQDQLEDAGLSRSREGLSQAFGFWSALYGVLLTHKYREDFSLPNPEEIVGFLCVGWGAELSQVRQIQESISTWSNSRDLSSFTHLDSLD